MRTAPPSSHRIQLPRRGAYTIEFAYVIPVMIIFFAGFVELGRAFMVSSLLDNAARVGCRKAILSYETSDDAVKKAMTDILTPQGVASPTITILVNNKAAKLSTANSGDEISVLASLPVAQATWLGAPFFMKGNLTGQYTLTRE